jgi:hypothetical protein
MSDRSRALALAAALSPILAISGRLAILGGLAAVFGGVASVSAATPRSLETIAERSNFRTTGRYDEVERLCAELAKAYPQAVRSFEFGRTPEGRPMLGLVVSTSGALTPDDARERGVPVMLAQGGIHAGEIDGKDAGFIAIREMLQGKAARGTLDSFVFVFVPVFNVDGHERFGRNNRPNQVGPEEMGWRVTSQNFNLNRDYAKADAPEMHAMLKLLDAWDPVLYVDLHVTDGAQFEPDISNTLEPVYAGDPGMQPGGRALIKELNAALATQGSIPLDFYPSFRVTDDPTSGFEVGASPPRFSTGYWALRNRYALLVETHSWKDYPTRVRVTRNILVKLSEMMAKQGRAWRTAAKEADSRAEKLGGQDVVVDYQAGPHATTIEFRGYAYTREPSPISGGLVTRYDTSKPQIWRIPLLDTVVPKLTVRAPRGAYVVPAAHAAWVGERLSLHGIRFERLERTATGANVEAFRATKVKFGSQPFESHFTATVTGEWKAERQDIPGGSLIVPVSQPKSRLVIALLEPQSPDSYAAWGFFNAAFEQKEFIEPYVAEDMAKEIMARDPAAAGEFRRLLATDPEFAKDPEARLDFFFKRHPSYDERLNLYPVFRIQSARP